MVATQILFNFLRKLILQRHLIWNFVRRDLKSRYVGSFMGFFWAVIHPLVLLLSYSFVFTVVLQIRLPQVGTEHFPLFLFCGILPWLYFQDTVLRSCSSVVDHGNLVRKTLFPSEILPVTIALSNLVTHLVGFVLLLVGLAWLQGLGWALLLTPVYLILLLLLALGLGWFLGALQVFLRDTAQILSVVMTFWFWFTPVFYQVEMVPPAFRPWIAANPLTHVVEGYRRLLLQDQLPAWSSLLLLAGMALASFLAGGYVFRTTKREFVDVL